jgi:virulence-associated protein VapD
MSNDAAVEIVLKTLGIEEQWHPQWRQAALNIVQALADAGLLREPGEVVLSAEEANALQDLLPTHMHLRELQGIDGPTRKVDILRVALARRTTP